MGIPPTIEVANLGMADSLILMVMALVVFGPRRLPQIGRQIGKLMYEFRKASNDFKFQMEEELRSAEEADRRKKEEEERQRRLSANPPAQIEANAGSEVSEAGSGTPEASPAPESSDPYGSTYGELLRVQAQAETTYPSIQSPGIQPPSTGEPVPAAWPADRAADPQDSSAAASTDGSAELYATPVALVEQAFAEKENAVIETAVEDTNKATEPAHNG
jgi:sec-independent protein translocase protein TatB